MLAQCVLMCASRLREVGTGGDVCALMLVWAGLVLGHTHLGSQCAGLHWYVGPIWVRLVQGVWCVVEVVLLWLKPPCFEKIQLLWAAC